jgi:hypothetical protein
MTRVLVLLTLFLCSASLTVQAQDAQVESSQGNTVSTSSFAATREMLLYRKTAAPYIVTVQGERFIDRAYFEIYVTRDGQPVPADTLVGVDVEPSRQTDQILVSDDTVNETGTPASYTAQYRSDGLFIINPMTFDAAGGWLVNIAVDGAGGVGHTSFQMRVYPHKPDTPIGFSLASVGLPVLVALIFLAIYRWRGTPLIRHWV